MSHTPYAARRQALTAGDAILDLCAAVLRNARRLFGAGGHPGRAQHETDARRPIAKGQQMGRQIQQRRVLGNPGVYRGVVKKYGIHKAPQRRRTKNASSANAASNADKALAQAKLPSITWL